MNKIYTFRPVRWKMILPAILCVSLACNLLEIGVEEQSTPTDTIESATITHVAPGPSTQESTAPQEEVYYVAPTGDDANPGTKAQPWRTIQKAVDTLTAGETVNIRAGTYNEHVLLTRSGSQGQFITFAAYPGESATVDAEGLAIDEEGGVFEIDGLSFIRIAGLRIVNSSGAGILTNQASDIYIEGNYTYNTVSSGIGVWRSHNTIIDGNEVELANNDGEQECITVAGTDGFEVRNNHVHHSGPGTRGGEGIDVKDGSSNGMVYRNHVHDLPARLGIYIDAWDKHTYNIRVFQNIVHDVGDSGFTLASEAGGLLENIHVFNNIAFHNKYDGITISGCCSYLASEHPMRNLFIINNTFYNNGWEEWGGGINSENVEAQNVIIRNNIVSQNLLYQVFLEQGVPAKEYFIDHNLIYGYRNFEGELYGNEYVEGDPLFINPSVADFHLGANSPAIDHCNASEAPTDDYDGNSRPQDGDQDSIAICDIGAYETQPAAP